MSTATQTKPVLNPGQAKSILVNLGFRIGGTQSLTDAVEVFQDCCRLTDERLRVDGIVGERTSELLLLADDKRLKGENTLHKHFSWSEFTCRDGGKHAACLGLRLTGPTIDAAIAIRAAFYTDGLHIVSGYRCSEHNGDTPGAASGSLHPYGAAFDIAPRVKAADIARLRVCTGIGYRPRRGNNVVHIDTRGMGSASRRSPNRTGSTVQRPAVFVDA